MTDDTLLASQLRALKLPGFARDFATVASTAEAQGWSMRQFLQHLAENELQDRKTKRIARNLQASNLPREKTLATLEVERLTAPMRRQLPTLCQGGFAERAENVLIFGLPGRGKTHVAIAIGLELIQAGMTVLFIEVFKLVQRLLVAKRDLKLERELQKLDAFDVLIIDDIGYIQQDRDEMEVLFTLLAERYERKSVMITSNLVFSQWDRIFKDPLTTQGAIDRVVHHAVILELVGTSYRAEVAGARTEPDAE